MKMETENVCYAKESASQKKTGAKEERSLWREVGLGYKYPIIRGIKISMASLTLYQAV